MLKKVANGFLILAILSYVTSVAVGDVFVYLLCFIILTAAISFRLLVLAADIIWKLLPADLKKTYEGKRGRFNAIIVFFALLFYIAKEIIGEFCLPEILGFVRRLPSNIVILLFAVFLAWSLIRRSKVKFILAGSVVFILFIALLSFAGFTTLKSGETAEANSIERLKSLPYVGWSSVGKDVEKTGVTRYDPELAFEGINLYHSRELPEVYLIDMHGNVVHKWAQKIDGGDYWRHAELCENGDLVVVAADQMLIRLDWDSNIKWKKKMRVHHDVFVDENEKTYYVVAREDRLVFWHGLPVPILGDYIAAVSSDGTIKKKIYIYELIKEQVSLYRIAKIYKSILTPKGVIKAFKYKAKWNHVCCEHGGCVFDITHTNCIEVMDRDIEGFCRKGDWLISIREVDLVAVLDPNEEKFIWSWGPGELSRQHIPTLLKNGNMLIFDNGRAKGISRIVELNPSSKKIVWEYKAEPPEKFYSGYKGCSQRLPNGNTLITESDTGRVFEITKQGKVVWEFYNPDVKTGDKKRGEIYRMMRITNPGKYKLDKI